MELIYVIVADAAQANSSGKFSILGGGIETINALAFPAIHPGLALVVRVSTPASEANQSHEFRVDIAGPNEYNVSAGGITEFRSVALPNESGPITALNLVINIPILVFPVPGTYLFRFYIDDKELGNYPLYVLELNPNGASSQGKQDK